MNVISNWSARLPYQQGFQQIQNNNNINKDMIGFQLLKQINSRINKIECLPSILDRYEENYNLRRYKISQISPKEAQKMYEIIEKKFYKHYPNADNSVWFQNQLRLFVWILVCYLQSSKKSVRLLNNQDWELFSRIFYVKQSVLFPYQTKILLDYSLCLQKWNQEQDDMLKKIVSGVIKIKWSQIAKSLFVHSDGRFVRTSKQCRERWLNHLDPSKSKQQWTPQECKELLKLVMEKGKKWANLVTQLKGKRSQHSIKNKFNSMMIKQTKISPELSERQKCLALISEMQQQVNKQKIEDNAFLAFSVLRELDHLQKQNQEQSRNENMINLQKSNASLAQTVTPDCKNGDPNNMEMELNLDDLWLDLKQTRTASSQPISSQMRPRRATKLNKTQNKVGTSVEYEMNIENMERLTEQSEIDSLIFLEQLKLMIRESQLDR